MPLATCPNREELAEYIAGKLPDEASESLGEHLESGSECQAAPAALPDPEDTLVGVVRQPVAAEPFSDEPECGRAVAEIKAGHGRQRAFAASAPVWRRKTPRRLAAAATGRVPVDRAPGPRRHGHGL